MSQIKQVSANTTSCKHRCPKIMNICFCPISLCHMVEIVRHIFRKTDLKTIPPLIPLPQQINLTGISEDLNRHTAAIISIDKIMRRLYTCFFIPFFFVSFLMKLEFLFVQEDDTTPGTLIQRSLMVLVMCNLHS